MVKIIYFFPLLFIFQEILGFKGIFNLFLPQKLENTLTFCATTSDRLLMMVLESHLSSFLDS